MGGGDKEVVREYFNNSGFQRWRKIYGDTDDAALRLVTCGGAFDEGSRSYRENVIVNASLAGSAPA